MSRNASRLTSQTQRSARFSWHLSRLTHEWFIPEETNEVYDCCSLNLNCKSWKKKKKVRFIFSLLASIDTVSQANQHPFLGVHIRCFPQGKPTPLIGCHLFPVCVCVSVMIGGRVRTVLVNKPQQLASTLGCFVARRQQFTQQKKHPTRGPEGASVSRGRALRCFHSLWRIHLHRLDKGDAVKPMFTLFNSGNLKIKAAICER